MRTLILIGLIILFVYLYYRRIRKHAKEVVGTWNCYTGSNGSGKTALCVKDAIDDNKKQIKLYRRIKFINEKLHIPYKQKDYIEYDGQEPILITSIPIKIGKDKYSYILKKEHLLLQEKIPFRSTILIDEIGEWADQFRYKDENIINVFNELARFIRHYTDSHVFCNDQTSDFIEEHVRKRINLIKVLSNFKVYLGFIVVYYERQIVIGENQQITIDQAQGENETDTQDNRNLKIKLCFNLKAYDTRCYRNRYNSVPKGKLERYTRLTKEELLECPRPCDIVYKAKTNRKEKKKNGN